MEVRKRVLSCYIKPILMYSCEAWTINNTIKKSIEATEMWFYRRILRIPGIAKQTNEEVLKRANDRRLIKKIQICQCQLIGHEIRIGQLKHMVKNGMLNCKRSRGR